MKRHSGDMASPSSKRQKNGRTDSPQHHEMKGFHQDRDSIRQDSRSSQPSRPPSKRENTVTTQDLPFQPDPLAIVEAILTSMCASNPGTMNPYEGLIGREAMQHAAKLLSHLTLRDKSPATSLLKITRPETLPLSKVPAYESSQQLQEGPLPPLPSIPTGPYSSAPFTHKSSSATYDRTTTSGDLTYERLEFLGDAYLEAIATRLIFSRYPDLPAGRQAQIREQLVKNETLLRFSQAYGFDKRLQTATHDSIDRGNKGTGKILADVFEAYVGALILSDTETGFARAETWLTDLWAPILLSQYPPAASASLTGQAAAQSGSSAGEYNPRAKEELQSRIMTKGVRIEYLEERPMVQVSKSVQKFFVGLYLTGWGHEKLFVGKGEGQNKVEAGNRAVTDAVAGSRDVLDEFGRKARELREQKKALKAKE